MELEACTTNTGPFSATIAPMTIDLIGPEGLFGRLDLPPQKTTSKGSVLRVAPQRVEIVDAAAFTAFLKATLQDSDTTLRLDNGHTTIKTMGLTLNVLFRKEVQIRGMGGPRVQFGRAGKDSGCVTVRVWNPSPLEVDLGDAVFDCRNGNGAILATLSGKMYLGRGESVHQMAVQRHGTAADVIGELRMVGVGVEQDSWLSEGITHFNVCVEGLDELANVL